MTSSPSATHESTSIVEGLMILGGAINTGVLTSGDRALLIDCCDTVTPERLAGLGVHRVDAILCTQHRRPNVAGAHAFVDLGAQLVVPAAERHLFEDVEAHWSDPANRWHIYHHQPGAQVLACPIPVSSVASEGDVLLWNEWRIETLETPGATEGSVSYLVRKDARAVCFCGDMLFGDGQIWDLYSLQRGREEIRDYHGFMGNLRLLGPSLDKLAGSGADTLVPSHGPPVRDPQGAAGILAERLRGIWRNHASVSSLNHYFPGFLESEVVDAFEKMDPAPTMPLPAHVRRVEYTSYAVVSSDGGALVIDCGDPSVVVALKQWVQQGLISSVDACWVTHYHDDHVDSLVDLQDSFGCPILCDSHVATILRHPLGHYLPCISPHPAQVDRVTRDRESWRWREFRLTAFHFPGQTLYGGGLLVEGRGARVFFAGDSGSPAGLDDHCPANRNLLGPHLGFRHCIALWRELRPDSIVNQHQDRAFRFSDSHLDLLDATLAERETILAGLFPWSDPNFGMDENWIRAAPYEQRVRSNSAFRLGVHLTNHGPDPVTASVAPVLPDQWRQCGGGPHASVVIPARTGGTASPNSEVPDGVVSMRVAAVDASPGRYVIPLRITWGDAYLGQFRHAIVVVEG